MPALLDLQRRFRTALLCDGVAPPAEIIGETVAVAARFDVYRNNVIGNLTRALRLGYPAIERLVGADFFAGAARHFIVAAPPETADLNQYGAGFADFLAAFEPAAGVPYLADIARLEWAVNRALHAPPAPILTVDALRELPPECQAELCFAPHPSLSLLRPHYPARAIWQAVLSPDDDTRSARFAGIDLTRGDEALAVLHGSAGLDVVVLSDAGLAFAQALANESPLSDAIERIAAEDAARLLADFLTRGFFTGALSRAPRTAITQSRAP